MQIDPYDAQLVHDALCRQNLADFTQEAFKIVSPGDTYLHNWHIECIAEHLHAVHQGDIKRLIINMPPRSLKSIMVSVCFPAWLLGKDPSDQIICASYSMRPIATKLSQDTRLIVESEWYRRLFPDTALSKDQNEKAKFMTTQRGGRLATSVGGSLTGEGANYLIFDDPNKPDEALSETMRNSTNDWIDQVFMSRLNNKKEDKIIGVMQRVHEQDVAGHLLEKDGWHHLCLPAIFTKKTLIEVNGKKWELETGSLLHEDREGDEELTMLRNDLGEYAFAGQYMQQPAPIGGGEFKAGWMHYFDNIDYCKEMNIYILVDPANEKKATSDYTAMMVIGLAPDNNYYLLDAIRDKLNPTERINTLINLHKTWNKLGGRPAIVGYEKYGIQSDIFFLKKAQDQINYRFHVVELGGQLKKEDRIRRLIPLFEQHRVYLRANILYTEYSGQQVELIQELVDKEMMTFPVGAHDDMLDAFARICDEDLCANFPKLKQSVQVNIDIPDWDGGENRDDFMDW